MSTSALPMAPWSTPTTTVQANPRAASRPVRLVFAAVTSLIVLVPLAQSLQHGSAVASWTGAGGPSIGLSGPRAVVGERPAGTAPGGPTGTAPVGAAPVVPVMQPGTGGGDQGVPPVTGAQPRPAVDQCNAPCSTSQVVGVTILPGPLSVDAVAPTLRPARGLLVADLGGVTVTDLRGSTTGWSLVATYSGLTDAATGAPVSAGRLTVTPTCTRTAGPLTVVSAQPISLAPGESAPLCDVPVTGADSTFGGIVAVTGEVQVEGAGATGPSGARLVWTLATT